LTKNEYVFVVADKMVKKGFGVTIGVTKGVTKNSKKKDEFV
jgi:hypothetical protein